MKGSSGEPKIHIIQLESKQYNQMMNSRGAWLSGREEKPSPVPANDPRSHRLHRRFFTALQDSQLQEDLSACPSIDNELPNIVINHQQQPFQQLIDEIQLKDQALGKATIMINLLKQENRQLSSQIVLLQAQLSGKQKTIDSLIQTINFSQRNSSYDPIVHTQNSGFTLTNRPTYNQKRKSKSELFQEYTQPKQTKHKFAATTIYPSLRDNEPQLLFTKQLTPYLSNHGQQETWTILQEIASKTIEFEITKNKDLIQSILELIEEEGQICYQKTRASTEQIKEVEQETEIFSINSYNQNSGNIIGILQQYRKTVEIYREYSAYLRCYLCQIINFLSETIEQSYPSVSFTKLLKLIKNRLSQVILSNFRQLQAQNKQLKIILQELIRNWQQAKNQQIHKQCATCSSSKPQTAMKHLQ